MSGHDPNDSRKTKSSNSRAQDNKQDREGVSCSHSGIILRRKKQKRAAREDRPSRIEVTGELVNLVHAAHAACAGGSGGGCLGVFFDVGDEGFGGEHQARDGRCVLQREAGDLGWVDDAHLDHVAVLAGLGVEAEVFFLGVADLADHNGAFVAGVESDLSGRLFESTPHDACANGFVIVELKLLDDRDAAEQCRAAAGDNAFLDSRAGGVHSVFDTGLLFLQLGFGGCADFDDGDAADQLGKALLELFLVVVGGGVFDLRTDLLDTAFDVCGLAGTFDDRGVVLVDGDLLGAAEVLKLHVLELDAEVFGDGLAAGEGGDVFEHSLAAVAKARGLDGGALQRAAELVHHEGREGFAFDVFRDDQEGLAHLGGLLEQGEKILHRADFLFVDEDANVFQHAFHAVRVGDEVGREVAAVELHAFDDFEGRLHRLGFLDGDDAIFAYLLHGFGDNAADLFVVIGGNGADLGDHLALDVLVEFLDLFHGDFHGLFDAALESSRAGACGDSLDALAEDGLSEHGRGGRAVTGNVGSLGSDFADHLRAHVLEGISELDLLGNGHAVLGDDGRAELLLDHRIAALGAEGDLHCVGKSIHAAQNRLTGILTCNNLLRHTGNSS